MRLRLLLLGIAGFFLCNLRAADFADRFEELKTHATPAQLYALLYDLPKGGDLHNHSGGEDRPEVLFTIATDPKRNGGDTIYTRVRFRDLPDAINPTQRFHNIRQHTYDHLPPDEQAEYVRLDALTPAGRADWCNSLRLDAPGEGRAEFFDVIWDRLGEIDDNLAIATEMIVENMKAFGAEHLVYLETQFGIEHMRNNAGQPIPADAAVAFVKHRLAQPDVAATGVTVRFQRTILRFTPDAEQVLGEAYAFVDAHRDLWVGLNMAGIEENGHGYPARFLSVFRRLRAKYPTLKLSIHAGEMDGPDSHIRDTLLLGASRIGHGTNLLKDPDTLLLLQQTRRVLIEVSLISNHVLEYAPDLTQHPFPEYLRTGIPVCLNTDDRGMWDSNLTDEYFTAVTTFHLSWDEIVGIGRNSLAFSFVQPDVKQKLLADYATRVAAFEQKYGAGSLDDSLSALSTVHPVAYTYAKKTWGLAFK
ncbi:MAG TPA: hypothetical protein VG710_06125 [Opitutus sp.]|nr:hypothetical protein [Opitutus sp.]